MLFDTHCHLNTEAFENEEEEAIARAKERGVTELAVVGFDELTIEKSLELSKSFDDVYSIIGWHPTEAGTYSEEIQKWINEKAKNPKVVAYGEIGLDYHWDTASRDVQEKVFRQQIQAAKALQLPIVIHMRDAVEDTYCILKDEGVEEIGGIMHSYSGDVAYAEKFLELGMHISLSGVVTFKKTLELKEVAKMVPSNRLLLETDAPYLAPVPYRGKRNEPSYVADIAAVVAELRGISVEELASVTTKNAHALFGLDKR